jgi:peptidoglycan/xylan/chitin deacetylase (PgdA/CDA1 family)
MPLLAKLRYTPAGPALGLARRMVRRFLVSAPVRAVASPLLAPRRGLCSCLVYHRVHADDATIEDWGNAVLTVSRRDFDRQMAWLARHRRCLALDPAIALLVEGRLPAGSAMVTFDDGYRDNLELALPVLERHGVPATIFVTTGLLDAARDPWWQELERLLGALDTVEVELEGARQRLPLRPRSRRALAFDRIAAAASRMPPAEVERLLAGIREQAPSLPPSANPMLDWNELARLASHPLITIGAHTVSHPPLPALPSAEAAREMEESRRVLRERTGATIDHFAYPYGTAAHAGAREAELAAAAGFRSAFTAIEGHLGAGDAARRWLLPRVPITRRDGIDGLWFKLSGWRGAAPPR